MNKLAQYFTFLFILVSGCREDTITPLFTGKIAGKVVEKNTGQPIFDAEITTTPTTQKVFSAADGFFSLGEISTASYTIRAKKDGFLSEIESVVLEKDDSIFIQFKMTSDTANNRLPLPPIYLSPANNTVNLPRNGTLRWRQSVDEDPTDVLKYSVLLFEKGEPDSDTLVWKSSDTSVVVSNLKFATTYLWQVLVFDGSDVPVFGPNWQFTTENFPDNRFLYCRKVDGVFQIFSSNQTGTTALQLTTGSANHWRPRMNPQRTKIAFLGDEGIDNQLFVMNRDGSGIQKLTTIPVAGFNSPDLDFCWSPDGSRLLYMNQTRLYRVNVDGSGLALFSEAPTGFSFSECDWAAQPTPRIAARTTGDLIYKSEILLYDEQGLMQSKIVADTAGGMGGPMFSIDGLRLVFCRDIDGFDAIDGRQLNSRIFLKNTTSGLATTASILKPAGTNDFDARWSPDGSKIIFMNTNNDGISPRSIWFCNLDGSGRTKLFDDAEMPDWR